ncbi:MAG: FliM/FliN family flagellar motor switch protein [Puniceicoccales bacterium]|jgi:flagellar motor switch/type III secretory pathway protein FliN|nr:FliM/FliN family flagellar motor switch protein [Puniceicoccales bacterium]
MADERENLPTDEEGLDLDELEEVEEEWDEESSEGADGEVTEARDSLPEEGREERGFEGQEEREGVGAVDGRKVTDGSTSPDVDEGDSPSREEEEGLSAIEREMPAELPVEDRNLRAPTAEVAHIKLAEATELQIPEAFLHAEYRKGTRASVAQMPVHVTFEVGRQSIRLGDLESLQEGFLFEGGNPVDASVNICANGQLIGKGSLLNIEGRIGVRVTEIF